MNHNAQPVYMRENWQTKLFDQTLTISRPMPRARATLINLLDQHQRQVERIAELEHLIHEVGQEIHIYLLAVPGEGAYKQMQIC